MNRDERYQKIRDNIRAIYVFSCLALVLVFSFIALWTVEDAGTAYLQNLPNDEAVDLLLDLQSNGVQEANSSLLVESSISPPINAGVLAGGAFSGLIGIGNQIYATGQVIEGDEQLGVIASTLSHSSSLLIGNLATASLIYSSSIASRPCKE